MGARALCMAAWCLLVGTGIPPVTATPFAARDDEPEPIGLPRVCVNLTLVGEGVAVMPTMRLTESEIQRIWQLNGVRIVYTPAGASCDAGAARSIVVRVGGRPELFPPLRQVSNSSLACTLSGRGVPSGLIYAFVDRIAEKAARHANPTFCRALLLARVIAHEIGHVLLASTAHAREGLMRAGFHGDGSILQPVGAYVLSPQDRAIVQRNLAAWMSRRAALAAQVKEQP